MANDLLPTLCLLCGAPGQGKPDHYMSCPNYIYVADPRGDYLPEDATPQDFIAWCERRGILICKEDHKQCEDELANVSHADEDQQEISAALRHSSITSENGKQRDELLREAVADSGRRFAAGCHMDCCRTYWHEQCDCHVGILERARAAGVAE